MDIDFLRFSLFICENVVPRILALRDQRNLRPYLLLELGRVDILVRQLEICKMSTVRRLGSVPIDRDFTTLNL